MQSEEKIFVVVVPIKPGDNVELIAAEVMRRLKTKQSSGLVVYDNQPISGSPFWSDFLSEGCC